MSERAYLCRLGQGGAELCRPRYLLVRRLILRSFELSDIPASGMVATAETVWDDHGILPGSTLDVHTTML